ncbi:MAG: hypothetical protein JW965_01605 [Bacteroidales bacterium]|nr:hypothetical protein [Bacteroidales bacterium]
MKKFIKGKWFIISLTILIFSNPSYAGPSYPDIRESAEIDSNGGSIMAEDPESGVTVGLFFPENALKERKTVTLVLHGSKQPGVIGKSHVNGITILPQDLRLLEEAKLEVYNPPVDVNKTMILYRVVNNQFIIPLGSQVQHIDEGYIEGTFYITGRFCLGTPTSVEITAQTKMLSSFNPARPLADMNIENGKQFIIVAENCSAYEFHSNKGPFIEYGFAYSDFFYSPSVADNDCLQWQKVLTQVEGHVTWMNQRRLSGADQSSSASSEQANAERALKHGIEDYLSKQSGANRCGGYLKAAEKYRATAIKLGMNAGEWSFIDQRYKQLQNECSFEFTVETREWIDHPKEKLGDGATLEEKSDWYGTIRYIIPPNEFGMVKPRIMAGEGTMNLHYEKHWVGDEKEDHMVTDGTWKARKITGSASFPANNSGVRLPADASVTIYWDQNVSTHVWGRLLKDKPYDSSGTETKSTEENKRYPLKHGYEEKIGNAQAGRSIKVIILRNPFDMKDDPNECF